MPEAWDTRLGGHLHEQGQRQRMLGACGAGPLLRHQPPPLRHQAHAPMVTRQMAPMRVMTFCRFASCSFKTNNK